MSWEKVRLEDICISITDGDHQSLPLAKRGIPFIVIANINSTNRIEFEKARYVPIDYYEKLDEKRKPSKGDVLLTVKGSFGIPVYVDTDSPFVFQRDIAIFKCNEKVNSLFLFYYMKNREFYLYADSVAIGAAQRALTLKLLKNTIVTIPSLEKQDKIVELLAPYDKLISNNQKQIKLLEEAAQRLYKEWFVDLRFPGYEDVKIVDGVPEGWNCQFLAEVVGYEIGGGWGEDSVTEKCDKPAYVIRGTDLHGITNGNISGIPYRYHSNKNLEARVLEDGDIIFEVSGGSKVEGVARTVLIRDTVLKILKVPVMCASFCKLVRVNEKQYSQLLFDTFQYMRSSGKTGEYDKKSASSIVNYRWKDFLAQETILIPTNELLLKYNSLSANLYQMILTKSVEIEKAKEARDRLLPKLMSGEIEV